jgi:hypothetical protein
LVSGYKELAGTMNEYVASTAPCAGVLFVRVVEAHVPEALLNRSFLKRTQHLTKDTDYNNNNNNNLSPSHSNTQTSQSHKRAKRWSFGKIGRKKELRTKDNINTGKENDGKAKAWTSCVLEFDGVEMEVPLHSFVRQPKTQSHKQTSPRTVSAGNISVAVLDEHDEHVKSPTVRQEQACLNQNQPADAGKPVYSI